MAGPLDPQGSPASGWILAVIEDEALRADIDRTIALWITGGVEAYEIWFELTRQRRHYVSWEHVKVWMVRWARRDHRAEMAQLVLPGFGRRAA